MKDDEVFCPLVDANVTIDDCTENREICEKYIPARFKEKRTGKRSAKSVSITTADGFSTKRKENADIL